MRRWPLVSLVVVLSVVVLSTAGWWLVTQPLAMPLPSRPPAVDPARLEAHVRRLSTELAPRTQRGGGLDRAAHYVRDQWRASGATVEEQVVEGVDGVSRNLIARFGPPAGPVLVVGAHYDSCDDRPRGSVLEFDGAPNPTPGADDNASGVAGLLELGRLLHAHPPGHAVELVAYTFEEPPYFGTADMGSQHHAQALADSSRPVRLMVALEMIGYFSDRPGSQSYPLAAMRLLYPDRGNFISLVGTLEDTREVRRAKALMAGASDLPVVSMNAPRWVVGVDFSDQRNYWQLGMPALMVSDTAFYRNPNYHLSSDTFNTLDYGRMAKVIQGVYTVVRGF